MGYIHELSHWPTLTWDTSALAEALAAVRHRQGRHLGRMEALGFELRAQASLDVLTDDVVHSSAIEGERLDPREVRSSLAHRLGLDVGGLPSPGRVVDGVVEMTLDATRNHVVPLSAERLFGWHAALFPTARSGLQRITVGAWRTDQAGPMRVVSGPIGKERIHFQAPAADRLEDEMAAFLTWFADTGVGGTATIDPVLRAAVAHLWFVTVHPFDDGNGRIARAIADMALAQADGVPERFYSMSSAIEVERRQYYLQLESAQRGSLDITAWLAWFLACLDRAIANAGRKLGTVLHKAWIEQRLQASPLQARQRRVIDRMLDDFQGHLTTSKYAKLAKCSKDTALRDIRDLLERGVIVANPGGGRSTSYRLTTSASQAEVAPGAAGDRLD